MTLYVVATAPDHDQPWSALVIARDPEHALAIARTEYDDAEVVFPAVWDGLADEPPLPAAPPERSPWGFWRPSDAVFAGYGIVPNEDWCVCVCCDLIVHEDDMNMDEDCCLDCAPEKP